MLIVGASKGIGKVCAEYFSEKYSVTTLARTNADVLGDICKSDFRDLLIKDYKPDIVVICAGKISNSVTETLELNYVAAADLISRFYNSLDAGSVIINISSIAALMSNGHKNITQDRINYNNSKNAISNFCICLSRSRTRDIRVTTLEPDIVMPTDFNEFTKRPVSESRYTNYNFNDFTPIKPIDIAKTIEWILAQPRYINISRITMNNHFLSK